MAFALIGLKKSPHNTTSQELTLGHCERQVPKNLTYFSVADRQMESLTRANLVFVRSLLDNILFYPNSLVIPDVYFIVSQPLATHVLTQGGSDSFLAACVAEGLIVPAFRNGADGTFQGALNAIKDDRIQGIRVETATEVTAALHVASMNGSRFRPITWPHELGVRFEREIRDQLARPTTPPPQFQQDRPDLAEVWKYTERWRTECIEAASRKTKSMGGSGLRRGEIMNAIAADLHYPDTRIDSIEPLLRLAADEPLKRSALEAFFLWVNLCYHKNHADTFQCALSFPRFDSMVEPLADHYLPGRMSSDHRENMVEVRELVAVPKASALLRMGSKRLIEARLSEGREYFERLAEWQIQPNEVRARALVTALKSYAERLVVLAARAGTPDLTQNLVRHVVSQERNREFMKIIFGAATSFVRGFVPRPIVEASKTADALIALSSIETEQTQIAHGARLPAELVVSAQQPGE